MSIRFIFFAIFISMLLPVVGLAQSYVKAAVTTDSCKNIIQFLNQSDGSISAEEYRDFSATIAGSDEKKQKDLVIYLKGLSGKKLTPNEIEKNCSEDLDKVIGSTFTFGVKTSHPDLEASLAQSSRKTISMLLPQGLRAVKSKPLPKWVNGHCSEAPMPFCNGNGPITLPEEFSALATSQAPTADGPLDAPFTESDCLCMEKILDSNPKNRNQLIMSAQNEYAQIDKAIFEAAGQKFLNEFALLYEDIRYYDGSTAWALKNKSDVADDGVYCTEPKDFQLAVQKQCGTNVSSIDQEARISAVFGSYGSKFDAAATQFAGSFKNVLSDFESPDKSYTREEFDKVRFGINSANPDIIVGNEIVTALIKDKEVSDKLNVLIASGLTPLAAITSILTTDNPSSLKKLFKKMDNKKASEVSESLYKSIGTAGFNDKIYGIFETTVSFNPGLKNLLSDAASFKSVASNMGNKGDFLSFAEKHGQLKSHFKNRCVELQKKLAEAVCTSPSELRSKVDRKDLISLVTKQGILKPGGKIAIEMAICASNRNTVPKDSVFSGLDLDSVEPYALSDFHKIKNDAQNKQDNPFSRAAANRKNPAQINISDAFAYKRVSSGAMVSENMSLTSMGPSSKEKLREGENSLAKSNPSDVVAIKADANEDVQPTVVESAIAKSSSDFQAPVDTFIPRQAAVSTPGQPMSEIKEKGPTTEAVGETEVKPFQRELTSALSNSISTNSKSLLGTLNESEAKELLEFRRKAIADSKQFSLDEEKNKMELLKAENEALETKLAALRKETQASSKNTSSNSVDHHGGALSFSEKTSTPFENSFTSGGQDGPEHNRTDFTVRPGSVAMRNVSGSAAAAANREHEAQSEHNLLVVSSQAGGQESEDPSRELINYLAKNETDAFTLIGLKESGWIFNVEVNENGKKEVKTTVIKYNALTSEAKLLVERRLSQLKKTESKTLIELEKKVLQSKSAFTLQALRFEILSIYRQ